MESTSKLKQLECSPFLKVAQSSTSNHGIKGVKWERPKDEEGDDCDHVAGSRTDSRTGREGEKSTFKNLGPISAQQGTNAGYTTQNEVDTTETESSSTGENKNLPPVKRKRGRPRINPQKNAESSSPPKQKRVRPPKNKVEVPPL